MSKRMGHRLTTALIFLNAVGFFACVILIAAYGNQTPDAAIHFTRSIQSPIRLFIVGAGLPLAAWEIAAAEFDRSNAKVRLLESWTTYFLRPHRHRKFEAHIHSSSLVQCQNA